MVRGRSNRSYRRQDLKDPESFRRKDRPVNPDHQTTLFLRNIKEER